MKKLKGDCYNLQAIEQEQQDEYIPQAIPQELGGHSSSTSIKYQLEFSELIDEISHTLKSEIPVMNNRGEMMWVTPEGVRPLINERGVNNIIVIFRSHLSKIFILSNLDQVTIEHITIQLGRNLIDDLNYNWKHYGIKDTAAASTIVNLVCNTVYATLRKGYNGNYLKFLSKTTMAQEIQHQSLRPSAQGVTEAGTLLGKLFGRKKR